MTFANGFTGWCSTHGGHNALACPACQQVAVEHVCALAEVGEHDAVTALVEILRSTTSASAVVARLAIRGMAIAKVEGRR